MADPEATPAKADRVGNDYHEGSNPQPGGDVDISDRTVPPYDDRSTGDDEVAAGVPRAMGSKDPLREPNRPGEGPPPAGGDTLTDDDAAPENVGESVNRRGEDLADRDGKEAGRVDTGTDSGTERPTGGSTPRDKTAIEPHDADASEPG